MWAIGSAGTNYPKKWITDWMAGITDQYGRHLRLR
jgi:hypothetical protein